MIGFSFEYKIKFSKNDYIFSFGKRNLKLHGVEKLLCII